MRGGSNPVGIRVIDHDEPDFYPLIGPFLARREIALEVGSPLWDEPGKHWLVALRDGRVVGLCAWLRQRHHVRLLSAYVVPEYRRQGVYAALFASRLEAVGAIDLRSTVTPASLGTFLRAGFRIDRRRGRYAFVHRAAVRVTAPKFP